MKPRRDQCPTNRKLRRRTLLGGAGAGLIAASPLAAPAALGQAKSRYAGSTIRVAVFAITYYEYLKQLLPEFEAQTGIKAVMDIQAFPVYNQRADLELSTRGSALDVVKSRSSIPDAGSAPAGSAISTAS